MERCGAISPRVTGHLPRFDLPWRGPSAPRYRRVMTSNPQSFDNVSVVRRIFEAARERDVDGLLAHCHRDVVVREPRSLPHGGEHRGLDQARAAAIRRAQTWEPYQRHA